MRRAISCIKLGVLPQYLAQIDDRNGQRTQQQAQEALALKTWTDQGFNRAEAKSYLTSVRQPRPDRPGERDCAGSDKSRNQGVQGQQSESQDRAAISRLRHHL